MRIRVGILALALAGLAGCGSFTSRFNGHGDEYYSGTQYSLDQAREGSPVYYADVPLSFLFDTVMLPVDAIRRGFSQ
ncbi:lipoprotein [Leminorella richardii]|uniref:Lipoprotein n=1 Tax=Leminorella richardii TaxID=158841 RepID=A0A2X4UTA7_9GAMM|nr:YceK/YidQ family lipoprotein [Leminorella richardii]SQI41689.1 lipoprotein [Leminorella richardii]